MRRATVVSTVGMVMLLAMVSLPVTVRAQDATGQAEAYHQQGLQLFQAGRYREAVQSFEAAEQLAHSRANLNNLARCYQQLGNVRRATRYVDQYLSEPGLPEDARARALELRQEILTSPSSGGGSLVGPWVVLGSGLALLLTGVALDIVAYVRSGEHEFTGNQGYQDWYDGNLAMAIAGDVLTAVGAAAAIGGLIWLLVARSRQRGPTAGSPAFAVTAFGGHHGGLGWQARFEFR